MYDSRIYLYTFDIIRLLYFTYNYRRNTANSYNSYR